MPDVKTTMAFFDRVTDANERSAAARTDRILARLHEQRAQHDASKNPPQFHWSYTGAGFWPFPYIAESP